MQTLELAALDAILPVDAFKQMSAFGALSDSFVEMVLARGELLKLAPGETLYRQGERAECFYVILLGEMTIYQDSEAGREIAHTSCAGASVGFPAMLAMRPRLLSGEAVSECVVLKISSQALARLQELDSLQFGIFFINLSRDMSRFLSYCILRPPTLNA
jgi:CRP-like cAMP-binding protein